MADIRSHKDLEVWQVSRRLAGECYRLTEMFPREEAFGQTTQIRRAAVSIVANIAEGYGRESTAGFLQFLRIAQGSQKELETLLLISQDVGLLTEESAAPVLKNVESVGRMLRNLIRSLEAKLGR